MTSIAIGCDDAGLDLKAVLLTYLSDRGVSVTDFGVAEPGDGRDYPDVAEVVAEAVISGAHDRAILICGTGIGMAITANKVPGIRAAQAHDPYSAERARKSNNAQVLTLGARVLGAELAKTIVDAWLAAEFVDGPSSSKIAKVARVEATHQRVHPSDHARS
jgi:ribose 5-phosphate isomerase B